MAIGQSAVVVATVRQALYMAAMSVIKIEGVHRRFYRRLRERGKVGKVALVAVMRKMLLQLNAVARRGTPWTEQVCVAIDLARLPESLDI